MDAIIQLWLDAEEENRLGNDEKCLELKEKFSKKYDTLSDFQKEVVEDYLEDLAG